MNKVWLVEVNDGSGWFPVGVYSTKRRAQNRVKALIADYMETEITELVINKDRDIEEETT